MEQTSRTCTDAPRLRRQGSGAKPSELQVQQPTKFDLVVNLTTAKAWCSLLQCVRTLLALSGHSKASVRLSAFGAKRTWRGRRWRIDRSLMTLSVVCYGTSVQCGRCRASSGDAMSGGRRCVLFQLMATPQPP